mgnify:CR=1 FL=1
MAVLSKSQMSEEDVKFHYITPAITAKWDSQHITLETDLDGSELFEVSLAELTPTKPTDEATDTTVGTAGTSIAGMLCEGRFALYLAGEPYKSGLKAQGCGKLKKAVFSIELDPDEEDETEE